MRWIKRKRLWIWIIGFLIFSNLYWFSWFFNVTIGGQSWQHSYMHYSSNNPKGFSVWANRYTFDYIQDRFAKYRAVHPEDSVLYRNFEKNPLKFWWWYNYLTNPIYTKIPFKPAPIDADSIQRDIVIDTMLVRHN